MPILPFFASLLITLGVGARFITLARRFFRSPVRQHTPQEHQKKSNTPTMGGLLVLGVSIFLLMLFGWGNNDALLLMSALVLFGALGALDDAEKILKKRGISKKTKFGLQVLGALGLMTVMYLFGADTRVAILHQQMELGLLYILWGALVIVAASNAVNLTDGLDGLAAGCLIPPLICFGLLGVLRGNGAIALACAVLCGALLGFLWFNHYPAQLFMGDVGSLALGAALGLIALMSKLELLLIVIGGVFVFETVSVIIQIIWYHVLKRKFFRLAPIHHHFELGGLHEAVVTRRFWLANTLLSLLGFMLALVQ